MNRTAKNPPPAVGDLVTRSAAWLGGKGVDSPRLDAELLLCRILNCDRLRLYMDWQKPLSELEVAAYRDFIQRRGRDREPVARITGRKSFYRREFEVTPDSFVPRPETEGVVERALMLMEKEPDLKNTRANVFEVGTGTGCIIVSLALESDAHRYIASDISPGALKAARYNATKLGVEGRVEFRDGAYFAGFEGTLSLIVSNPPYINTDTIAGLPPEVSRHDPMPALDGGADGLDAVRGIIDQGTPLLAHGGWVVLELGEDQPHRAAQLFRDTGKYDDIRVEKDLAAFDRYLLARRG